MGILLFAHGSPVEEANQGVHELAKAVAKAGSCPYVRAAFLDGGRPDLLGGVSEAAAAGIKRLIIVPYFLTVGLHLRRDMPKLIAAAQAMHPNLEIIVGQSLEGHPSMPSILLGLADEAIRG